ncbi:MAG: tRNA preQ1(34) S-adenosylmethionine ribosyltransferase-isomerase QueA [Patescibacteria group bacterium]
MRTDDFDYDLPKKFIAQHPASPRDSSKLLVFERETGLIQHKKFSDLPEILQPDDVLVINESKVIPARLQTTQGREVFLAKRVANYCHPERSEGSSSGQRGGFFASLRMTKNMNDKAEIWECLIRGGKHFSVGATFEIAKDPRSRSRTSFTGEVLEVLPDGERVIRFHSKNFQKDLAKYGASPLPPYIHQTAKKVPQYQTVYAKKAGSVAAPTAGLHFTERVFKKLHARGIQIEKITLHVGLGTFAPVKVSEIEKHEMHSEFFVLPEKVADRLNKFKKQGRRIIAVGSTSCRVLESCADSKGVLHPKSGETDIFIFPGKKFKFIDGMLTNFHLPKSTLIMLVAAFIGREKILELYELAKRKNYRFFSFGDATLLR